RRLHPPPRPPTPRRGRRHDPGCDRRLAGGAPGRRGTPRREAFQLLLRRGRAPQGRRLRPVQVAGAGGAPDEDGFVSGHAPVPLAGAGAGRAVAAQPDVSPAAAPLYFLLAGRAPFQSDNAAVTLARIASDPPPSLRTLRPELSPALDAVVLRGLERDRKRRWRDLDGFAQALRPFLPGRLSLGRPGVR